MRTLHFEDALNALIEGLARVPAPGAGQALPRQTRAQGSDIWIDQVAEDYWRAHGHPVTDLSQDAKEPLVSPFYDAAWELCMRGVLRPAAAVPAGQKSASQLGQRVNAAPFFGAQLGVNAR